MMAIPNQTGGWQEFGKAFGGTNKVFQDLMQRALERQKLRELSSEHAEDYGLRKEAGGRAAQQLAMQQQLAPFQLQLAKANATKAQQQLDPDYEANKFRRTMEALGAIGSNPTQRPQPFPNPNAQQFNALKEVMKNRNFQGQGAFTGQERPQDPEQFNQEQMMESNPQEQVSQRPQYNPLQIAYAKSKGIDLTKETPDEISQRKANENLSKLQQDYEFKKNAKKEEDIKYYHDAVPHLHGNLKLLLQARDIVKGNPDLFGHRDEESYLRTSTNPAAGKLVRSLLPTIIDTETKLSKQGSQLALKVSKGKAPNVTDSQQSALGKVEGALEETEKDIANSLKLSGDKGSTTAYMGGKSFNIPNSDLLEFIEDGGHLYESQ